MGTMEGGSKRWSITRETGIPGLNPNREKEWTGPFMFAQLADTQLGMMNGNREWGEELNLLKQAVNHINILKPRFVIICGDLVDAFPIENQSNRTQEVEDFKKEMERIDESIPLICVCGNHDVGNRPNFTTIQQYQKEFGDDYMSFWVGGCRCIVLNTALYFDPTDANELYLQQHQWLLSELSFASAQKATHTFIFGHHPWFLMDENEDTVDGEWTFTGTNASGNKFTVSMPNSYFHIPLERRRTVLQAFYRHNVRAAFAGHWHKCGGKRLPNGFEMIITSAVGAQANGAEGSGFRLVKVFEDDIVHKYFPFEQMPDKVPMSPSERLLWQNDEVCHCLVN